MEKKNIIAVIVLVLLISIIGVTIFFVNKQGEDNSQNRTNNVVEDETTKGPRDAEEIPSETIETPKQDGDNNAAGYIFTQ